MNFQGEARRNTTHASTTDPQARLYRKGPGREAKLCYMGHVLKENRHGLIVNAQVTQATGTAERAAALEMATHLPRAHRVTVGADKAYAARDFVAAMRQFGVTPPRGAERERAWQCDR